MAGLIKRKKTTVEEQPKEAPKKKSKTPVVTKQPIFPTVNLNRMISTGSTLLDLAISGGKVRGGGIPAGIMMELFGPSSSGKTTLLVEIGASVQDKGGEVDVADPEARLDRAYTEMHGLQIPADHYSRPDTVNQVFDEIYKWDPVKEDVVNMYAADSIAALCSDLELGEDGDKRGQKKAKDLSEGCRKTARVISKANKLVVFTNQERQSEYGKTTPGGFAVGYHSSLRIRIARVSRIEPEKTVKGTKKKIKKTIGILSEATIIKSSIDDEYRKAPLYIVFGFGIDDIRANLQWYKEMTASTTYESFGHSSNEGFSSMDAAISNIEKNNLEGDLREIVIDLWGDIEEQFKVTRKKKKRW